MSMVNPENVTEVPQNDGGGKDLLAQADTVQDIETQALTTKVTSIAEEEERTGQKIEMPSPEEMVTRASSSLLIAQQRLDKLASAKRGGKYLISRKGMNRVLHSILSLPTEDIPVTLQEDAEIEAFALGQNMIRDRFIIMQHHISEELKRRAVQRLNAQAEQAEAAKQTEVKEETKGEQNEQST